jgi:hypothetical protein
MSSDVRTVAAALALTFAACLALAVLVWLGLAAAAKSALLLGVVLCGVVALYYVVGRAVLACLCRELTNPQRL